MQAKSYQCPGCGSALSFDSSTQDMFCPSCGNRYEVENIRQYADSMVNETRNDEINWDTGNQRYTDEEKQRLHAWHCPNCGAEILTEDEDIAAAHCVYCGNPTVMPGVLSGAYRPSLVIPFSKGIDEARAALKKHCSKRLLLPSAFKTDARMEKVTGIYVPFWLYDCDADATMNFRATRVHSHREGNYEVTRTQHYQLTRSGYADFKTIPVDGASKIEDALMESLEPFDPSQAQAFDIRYLTGFQARRYDEDAQTCAPRANRRVRQSMADLLRRTVEGYTTVTPGNMHWETHNGRATQALLPVWILNTRWKDRIYTFAMNGQTGKFIGDLPVSPGRFVLSLLGFGAGLFAVLTGICYLLLSGGVL